MKNDHRGFSVLAVLVIIIVATAVVGIGWNVYQQKAADEQSGPQIPYQNDSLTIPERVSLGLSNIPRRSIGANEPRKPWLNLWAYTGSGCAENPDLEIAKTQHDTVLTVNIAGYKFAGDDTPCAALAEARANIEIDLDWLTDGSQKDVVFNLDGQNNTYTLARTGNQMTLMPRDAPNVISHAPGSNQPDTAEALDMTW